MGTSAACMYIGHRLFCSSSNGLHNSKIWQQATTYYFWNSYVDGIMKILIGKSRAPGREEFKKEVDNFGILEWELKSRPTQLEMEWLLLNISKSYGSLPIPELHAQPTTWHDQRHNIQSLKHIQKIRDYLDVVVKLFKRHTARDWNKTVLKVSWRNNISSA